MRDAAEKIVWLGSPAGAVDVTRLIAGGSPVELVGDHATLANLVRLLEGP